jgi:hypothetical protein
MLDWQKEVVSKFYSKGGWCLPFLILLLTKGLWYAILIMS